MSNQPHFTQDENVRLRSQVRLLQTRLKETERNPDCDLESAGAEETTSTLVALTTLIHQIDFDTTPRKLAKPNHSSAPSAMHSIVVSSPECFQCSPILSYNQIKKLHHIGYRDHSRSYSSSTSNGSLASPRCNLSTPGTKKKLQEITPTRKAPGRSRQDSNILKLAICEGGDSGQHQEVSGEAYNSLEPREIDSQARAIEPKKVGRVVPQINVRSRGEKTRKSLFC